MRVEWRLVALFDVRDNVLSSSLSKYKNSLDYGYFDNRYNNLRITSHEKLRF